MLMFALVVVLWLVTVRIAYVLGYNTAIELSRSVFAKLLAALETTKTPQDD